MPFHPLIDIAVDIARQMNETKKFRKVLISSATNTSQVYDSLEALVALPAAIVCFGDLEYDDNNLVRTARPIIIVADQYRKGMEAKAGGVWALLKIVEGLFLPEVTDEGGAAIPDVLGIEFGLAGSTPVESDSANISAYAITLQGKEFLNK